MTRNEPEAASDAAIQSIQSTLTKIIEQTNSQRTAAPVAPSNSGADNGAANQAALAAAAAEHQKEMARREQEIQALKMELQNKPKEGGDNASFLLRIKELEGKLAEYEILEDDIADLSLFKEENSRLKAELEALKGQANGTSPAPAEPEIATMIEPVAEPVSEPVAVEAAPAAPAESTDFVAEFQAAVDSEPTLTTSVKEAAPTADILAEFSNNEATPPPAEEAKKA
jgi:hypothetical protein